MNKFVDTIGALLYQGNCVEVMADLPADSFDTVITDPPYGIRFMGEAWDGADIEREALSKMRKHTEYPGYRDHHYSPAMAAGTYDFSRKGKMAFQVWCTEWAAAALRVTKPGGFLLAFGGTRTYHRLACALEDAGWELRDCLMWLYGQGFPKSLDISKAMDKAAGVKFDQEPAEGVGFMNPEGKGGWSPTLHRLRRAGESTDDAQTWNGWGTALKPGWEPILLAMKPTDGTFAENALRHGVAGLNIDGGRIAVHPGDPVNEAEFHNKPNTVFGQYANKVDGVISEMKPPPGGRWPANVILTHHPDCELAGTRDVPTGTTVNRNRGETRPRTIEGAPEKVHDHDDATYAGPNGKETIEAWDCHADCPVRLIDEQSGDRPGGNFPKQRTPGPIYGAGRGPSIEQIGGARSLDDVGGASRFFYHAKASGKDRGNEDFPELPLFGVPAESFRNLHPTVKPLDLMRYLCRLTSTPTGGTVLEPFAGSGTTLLAARLEGRPVVGIELSKEYCEIAKHRLDAQDVTKLPQWRAGDPAPSPDAG